MESYTANILSSLPALSLTLPYVGTLNVTAFITAISIFFFLSVFFKVGLVILIARLKVLSSKTSTDIDDVIINALAGVRTWVYTLIALYVSLQFFPIPATPMQVVTGLVFFAVAWQAIEIALCFIEYVVARFLEVDADDGKIDPNAATASDMFKLIARIVLWAFGIIFVLSNVGIEVGSLIAGLGIGGIAIAFALQGILSDLFASFSIYFDKPFRIGDFIIIGADSGTVEKIGIKSTRIRTLQGEELVVSNAELTTARVQNFKKMQKRRIVSQFGILYETPHHKVAMVNGIVERIFEVLDEADMDRIHFTGFGDSALLFELVYFVQSSDYNVYLNVQQQFNQELLERFAEQSIEFAYPTQTIYSKTVS